MKHNQLPEQQQQPQSNIASCLSSDTPPTSSNDNSSTTPVIAISHSALYGNAPLCINTSSLCSGCLCLDEPIERVEFSTSSSSCNYQSAQSMAGQQQQQPQQQQSAAVSIDLLYDKLVANTTKKDPPENCVTATSLESKGEAPAHSRGRFTALHHVMVAFGELVIVLMGIALHPLEDSTEDLVPFDRAWWRVMVTLTMVPSLVLLIIFYFVLTFETPQFYVRYHHDFVQSSKVLRMMNPPSRAAEAEEALTKAAQRADEADCRGLTFGSFIANPKYRYVLFVGTVLSALSQVTGINYYISSSNKMLLETGLTNQNSTLVTSLLMFAHFIATLPVFWLIERLGRRRLLLYGTVLMVSPLTPSVVCLWFFPDSEATIGLFIAGTVTFMIFFSCSYGPVVWCFVSEIFPLEIKHVGTSFCSAVHWSSAIIVVGISHFLPHRESITLFFVMGVMAYILTFLLVKETKNRPVDDSPYVNLT